MDKCKHDQFPNLKLFFETSSTSMNDDVKIRSHLQYLSVQLRTKWDWVNIPFGNHLTDHLLISEQEKLIDISCNNRLKVVLQNNR